MQGVVRKNFSHQLTIRYIAMVFIKINRDSVESEATPYIGVRPHTSGGEPPLYQPGLQE